MNIYKQIFKQIKKYDTIVIARHIGADPDALGSQFALKNIILELFQIKKFIQLVILLVDLSFLEVKIRSII